MIKTPNIDGYLELIDHAGCPVGKIEVQVKTLRKNYSKASYNISLALLEYIKRCPVPFLFVAVDQSQSKIFWIEIDRFKAIDLIDAALLKKSSQKTISVSFGVNNVLPDNSPYDIWNDIVNERLNMHQEFSKVKEQLAIAKEQLVFFESNYTGDNNIYYKQLHRFLDSLNDLFKREFNNISALFLGNFWKFGIVILGEINENKITYSLFSIGWEENSRQINAYKNDNDFLEFAYKYPSVRVYSGANPIISKPQKYAYEKLWEYLQLILKKKYIWPNNKYSKIEYLFYIKDYVIEKSTPNKDDNINLVYFKEKIDEYLLNIPSHERQLMKDFPSMEINVYRAIDYIQDVRINGEDIIYRLSPSREQIRVALTSITANNLSLSFYKSAEEIFNSYWQSLANSYLEVIDELFPMLGEELNFYGEYNTWIIVPIQLELLPNSNIPIPHLKILKFNIVNAPSRIIIESDFKNVSINFNNTQTLTYNGEKYSDFETETMGISKLVDNMPIRNGVYILLNEKLKKYFDKNIN